jgi:hypothetical protein
VASAVDGGYTLAEALSRYSDRDVWARYIAIERDCLRAEILFEHLGYPILDPTGGDSNWQQLSKKRDSAREILDKNFVSLLCVGKLLATGISMPMLPTSVPVQIPAHQWRVIKPEFTDSTAQGTGIRYEGVRVVLVEPKATNITSTGARPSSAAVREFVRKIARESEAVGRPLTSSRLDQAARDAGFNASRDQLRDARKDISPAKMGRPRKPQT